MSSEYVLSISSFPGLNTVSGASPAETGEASYADNFILTEDLKLKKRGGFRPLSPEVYEGEPIMAAAADTGGVSSVLFYLLTTLGLYAYEPLLKIYRLIVGFDSPVAGGFIFSRDKTLYCLAGGSYFRLMADAPREVEGYVPLIALDKKPDGSVWTPFEEPNLLNRAVRESFTADGTSVYKMKYTGISEVSVLSDGAELTGFSADEAAGTVSFEEPPPAGAIVEVTYSKEQDYSRSEITALTRGMFYGGKNDVELFLWGNGNSRYCTEGGRVDYFPLNNHTYVGENAPIIDIVRHYDRQIIFTSDAVYYSTVDLSGELSVKFPVCLLNGETGIDPLSRAAVAGNRPVFPSGGRLYELTSTASRDEKNVNEIGRRAEGLLRGKSIRTFYLKSRSEVWFVTGDDTVIYSTLTGRFMSFMGFSPLYIFELNGETYFAMSDKRIYICDGTIAYDIDGEGNEKPFTAVYRMEGLDFGAPYSKKRIKELFVRQGDGACERLRIEISADSADTGAGAEFFSGCMDFSDTHFSHFSFAKAPSASRRRLAGDRFIRLGVTVTDGDIDSRSTLDTLTLPARVLDKSV